MLSKHSKGCPIGRDGLEMSSEVDPDSYQEKKYGAEPSKMSTGTTWYI